MMKYLVGLIFTCFLGVSIYLLLNEGKMKPARHVQAKKERVPKIGEKKTPDLPVYELQRQRIDDTVIYKFESKNPEDDYEMNEEELDAFSRGLNGLRDARDAGQVQLPGIHVDENRNEKEYYMYDR